MRIARLARRGEQRPIQPPAVHPFHGLRGDVLVPRKISKESEELEASLRKLLKRAKDIENRLTDCWSLPECPYSESENGLFDTDKLCQPFDKCGGLLSSIGVIADVPADGDLRFICLQFFESWHRQTYWKNAEHTQKQAAKAMKGLNDALSKAILFLQEPVLGGCLLSAYSNMNSDQVKLFRSLYQVGPFCDESSLPTGYVPIYDILSHLEAIHILSQEAFRGLKNGSTSPPSFFDAKAGNNKKPENTALAHAVLIFWRSMGRKCAIGKNTDAVNVLTAFMRAVYILVARQDLTNATARNALRRAKRRIK